MTLGDTVTTDHISPAGPFGEDLPAGQWLAERGVEPHEFNTYGSRRGNHEVMMRGTFANVRIENEMLDDVEGGYTIHHPTEEETTVFEASGRYRDDDTPLIVMSGVEFGTGSSRDWAAKGTDLLGVRATIAESYERIYRDNLVGMGVLPLQFAEGDSWSPGPRRHRGVHHPGLEDGLDVMDDLRVEAEQADGSTVEFPVTAQVGTPAAVTYVEHGGILHYVLRRLLTRGVSTRTPRTGIALVAGFPASKYFSTASRKRPDCSSLHRRRSRRSDGGPQGPRARESSPHRDSRGTGENQCPPVRVQRRHSSLL